MIQVNLKDVTYDDIEAALQWLDQQFNLYERTEMRVDAEGRQVKTGGYVMRIRTLRIDLPPEIATIHRILSAASAVTLKKQVRQKRLFQDEPQQMALLLPDRKSEEQPSLF